MSDGIRPGVVAAVTLAAIGVAAPAQAAAGAGSLDPAFGGTGSVRTDFGGEDTAYATALQADGKLVVAGYARGGSYDFALARYRPDGSLDPTFGTAGTVRTDIGAAGSDDVARAVVIQPDGRIVAAGSTGSDTAVVRYAPDGELDSTFGDGGVVRTDVGLSDSATAVTVAPGGLIVVAGPVDGDFGITRYRPNGTVAGSPALVDLGGADYPEAVAAGADGTVTVAGYTTAGGGDFAAARLRPDGSLDPRFGAVRTDIRGAGRYDEARALALEPDGAVVLAGSSDAAGTRDFALARYGPDGTLDGGFGDGGTVLTDLTGSGGYDAALGVAVSPGGGLVAAGAAGLVRNTDTAVARYHDDGSLDGGFGDDGTAVADLTGATASDTAFGLAVRPDGRIDVAGSAGGSDGADFAVAQFLG